MHHDSPLPGLAPGFFLRTAGLLFGQFGSHSPGWANSSEATPPQPPLIVPRAWDERPQALFARGAAEVPMFEQLRPGAAHTKLWRALLVIALMGAVGIVLLVGLSK